MPTSRCRYQPSPHTICQVGCKFSSWHSYIAIGPDESGSVSWHVLVPGNPAPDTYFLPGPSALSCSGGAVSSAVGQAAHKCRLLLPADFIPTPVTLEVKTCRSNTICPQRLSNTACFSVFVVHSTWGLSASIGRGAHSQNLFCKCFLSRSPELWTWPDLINRGI